MSDSTVLEFLRSDERRLFSLWLATPGRDPLVHVRAAAWRKSLRALHDEMEHRAAMALRSAGVAP